MKSFAVFGSGLPFNFSVFSSSSSSSHLIILVESSVCSFNCYPFSTLLRAIVVRVAFVGTKCSIPHGPFVSSTSVSCCCRRHCFPVFFVVLSPKRCSARCFFISVGVSLGSTLHLHSMVSSFFSMSFLRVAQLEVYFLASLRFLVFSIIYDVIVARRVLCLQISEILLFFFVLSELLAVAQCTMHVWVIF